MTLQQSAIKENMREAMNQAGDLTTVRSISIKCW